MKLVKESISFERGTNPHKSMQIGEFRPLERDDIIEAIYNLEWNSNESSWIPVVDSIYWQLKKGEQFTVTGTAIADSGMPKKTYRIEIPGEEGYWVPIDEWQNTFRRI